MTVSSTLPLPEKDFKAVIHKNRIEKVGIEFFEDALAAQPLYKLNKEDWNVWLARIEEFCEKERVSCYAENAFNEVSDQCLIRPLDVQDRLCAEQSQSYHNYTTGKYLQEFPHMRFHSLTSCLTIRYQYIPFSSGFPLKLYEF